MLHRCRWTGAHPLFISWPPEKVEVLLRDDPAILAEWHEATTAPKGRPASENTCNTSIKPIYGRPYLLQRLKQQEPELFKRVTRGELSAHAAAIEAGWRKKLSALDQIRRLWAKLNSKERTALLREFADRS